MRFKKVLRWSSTEKMFRLFRATWEQDRYSAKFSVALKPKLFHFHREYQAWILVFLGVRLHYKRSSGGRYIESVS